jgi:hypothetical protein
MNKPTLSDKGYNMMMITGDEEHNYLIFDEKDVKEFIKELKEDIIKKNSLIDNETLVEIINKKAGEKLR